MYKNQKVLQRTKFRETINIKATKLHRNHYSCMTNDRRFCPENEATAQHGAGMEQKVATSSERIGREERALNYESGRGHARGRQRKRRGRRSAAQSSLVHDLLQDENLAAAESPLWLATFSFGNEEREEEIVIILNRKLDDMGKPKNELQEKVYRISAD